MVFVKAMHNDCGLNFNHVSRTLLLIVAVVVGAGVTGGAQTLPDLIVNRSRVAHSVGVESRNVTRSDCAFVEGCVSHPGRRKLLLFEATLANVGTGDLVIGSPADNAGLFQYSLCHGHYHTRQTVQWTLTRLDGKVLKRSAKRAFCLTDTEPYSASAGPSSGFNCENQGLTAGWQDVYARTLDCQWLDVTGVPKGRYLLKVTVNPNRRFRERNYGNNTVTVPVRINQ
jgi:hypothetical protein